MTRGARSLAIETLGDTLDLSAWSRAVGAPARIETTIRPPGSKSLTNRAMLLAMLGPGVSVLRHALVDADDAVRMRDAIGRLGAVVEHADDDAVRVRGVNARPRVDPGRDTLDLGNAGTATRFLAASCVLADRPVTITGNARMRQRPIGELTGLLERLGCAVAHEGAPGCVPIRITPPATPPGGMTLEIPPTQSSQFVSALLLVAPFLDGGLTLSMAGGVTSASYVRMTIALLDRLGVRVQHSEDMHHVRVSGGIDPFDLEIEPDASGATYWWSAGALMPGSTVRVAGFGDDPIQGDARFPELLGRMGCAVERDAGGIACRGVATPEPIMCDMRDMPDAVMSLASVACFARGTTIVRGVKTLRVKECDRIRAMRLELAKIGVAVQENLNGDEDALSITPPGAGVDVSPDAPPVAFDTYDDHRMAMSLALIALRRPNVTINDPACVEKTYPQFWEHFARLRG